MMELHHLVLYTLVRQYFEVVCYTLWSYWPSLIMIDSPYPYFEKHAVILVRLNFQAYLNHF